MARTRVKICGITRREDAHLAVQLGADALGFNFYESSRRFVSNKVAADITRDMPGFVSRVGLFVNLQENHIRRILREVPLDILQFHGSETPGYCRQFGVPYIKAIKATTSADIATEAERYPDAVLLLLDTVSNGSFGGTGEVFDWEQVPKLTRPYVLAGGLNPGNVGDAIRQLRPYAVDVSGGVEQSAGIKDENRLSAFFKAVYQADQLV